MIAAVGFPALAHGEPEPAAFAAAAPDTGSVIAFDMGFRDGSQPSTTDSVVNVAVGGTVTFSYPTGTNVHNVAFGTAKPTSCVQTKQASTIPITAAPPLPSFAQPVGWEGTCTFGTVGTYTFICSTHPSEMTGTIIVEEAATPTPTATPTGTATATPTATPTPTPTPTPTASPTATPTPGATPVASANVIAHDTASPLRNWFENDAVTIQPGQSVHFSFTDGTASHNVDFGASTLKPASCTQTVAAGAIPIMPAPPLPAFAQPKGWAGDCTFNTEGVYSFVCSAHPVEMKGTITVGNPAPTPTPTPTPTPERDANPAPTPQPWATLFSPRKTTLAALVSGDMTITAHCASVNEGTVTVTVTKKVARRLGIKGTTLASGSSRCELNNRFSAVLKPTKEAKQALKRYRRAVEATARLTFQSATGPITTTRKIKLKGRS